MAAPKLALGRFALTAKPSHPDKLAKTQPAEKHPDVAAQHAQHEALRASGQQVQPNTANHPVNRLPPRFDQGQSGSCTAHALSALVATIVGWLFGIPSPQAMYAISGAIARALANVIGLLPKLQDNGRELADEITGVMACGPVPMQARAPGDTTSTACPTPDGRRSDLWTDDDVSGLPQPPPANVNNEPDGLVLEQGISDRLSGAHTQNLQAPNALDVLAAALDAGIGLYVGFLCDMAFQRLGFGSIAQPANTNDPGAGGHSVGIVSWRWSLTNPGQREWLIVNSWGPWAGGLVSGDGMVWASDAAVLSFWEVWLVTLSMATASQRKAA